MTEVTVREAAESLGLSPVTVRKAFREGKLSGTRIGHGRWRRGETSSVRSRLPYCGSPCSATP